MADISQPSFMGYTLTPWMIGLCICIVGFIVFLILLLSGLSGRKRKEAEMIIKANKHNASISIKTGEQYKKFTAVYPLEEETEKIDDEKTEGMSVDYTEKMQSEKKAELPEDDKTLALEENLTAAEKAMKPDEAENAEGLPQVDAADKKTEAAEKESAKELKEEISNSASGRKMKYCSRCGAKATGKYCSRCGYEFK